MPPLDTPVVPVNMEQARQQLERWRSTRAHRSPIPEPLWALAVQLARGYGIFATRARVAPGLYPAQGTGAVCSPHFEGPLNTSTTGLLSSCSAGVCGTDRSAAR